MPVDPGKYHNFINNLDIINITAPQVSWELIKAPPKNKELLHTTEIDILDPIIENHSKAIIRSKLTVKGQTQKAKKPFMIINVLLHLSVKVDSNIFSEEMLDAYIHRNALLTLVATFREHVKYATYQMGLRPLVLPALKIAPPRQTDQKKSKGSVARKKSK